MGIFLDMWPGCHKPFQRSNRLCCIPDLIAGPGAVLNLRLVPVVGLEHLGCSTRYFSPHPPKYNSSRTRAASNHMTSLIECLGEEILRWTFIFLSEFIPSGNLWCQLPHLFPSTRQKGSISIHCRAYKTDKGPLVEGCWTCPSSRPCPSPLAWSAPIPHLALCQAAKLWPNGTQDLREIHWLQHIHIK